jgi:hypothetical protein
LSFAWDLLLLTWTVIDWTVYFVWQNLLLAIALRRGARGGQYGSVGKNGVSSFFQSMGGNGVGSI